MIRRLQDKVKGLFPVYSYSRKFQTDQKKEEGVRTNMMRRMINLNNNMESDSLNLSEEAERALQERYNLAHTLPLTRVVFPTEDPSARTLNLMAILSLC